MPKGLDSVEREWRIEEAREEELDELRARIAELEARPRWRPDVPYFKELFRWIESVRGEVDNFPVGLRAKRFQCDPDAFAFFLAVAEDDVKSWGFRIETWEYGFTLVKEVE